MKTNFRMPIIVTTILLGGGLNLTTAQQRQQARNPRYENSYEHREFQDAGQGKLKYGWLAPAHPEADKVFRSAPTTDRLK